MSTKTEYDPAAQEAWEAKIDALSPNDVFVAVALDPSPLHRHLGIGRFEGPPSEGARERRTIEHAVYQTLARMGEAEISFRVRQPAYSDGPTNAVYEVTGRVAERDAAVLGLGGDLCLVVTGEGGRSTVFPARYVDSMELAR